MIEVIDGDLPEGFEIRTRLYETECSAPSHKEALDALAERADQYFAQWAQNNNATGHRVALADVVTSFDRGRGRHAASIFASIIVLAPKTPKPRPVDVAEQAKLSGVRAPTAADHKRTLRAALVKHERGEPVDIGRLLPSMLALLIDDEEAECSPQTKGS